MMRKNACFVRRRIKVFYSHMIKFFIRLSSSSDISSNDHYSIFNQQYFLNSLKSESKRRSLRTNKISQVFHQRGSSMTSLFCGINSFISFDLRHGIIKNTFDVWMAGKKARVRRQKPELARMFANGLKS